MDRGRSIGFSFDALQSEGPSAETPQPRMSSERAVEPISPIAQQASLSMEELLYDEDMMEEEGMRDVGDLTEEEYRPTSHCLTRTMKCFSRLSVFDLRRLEVEQMHLVLVV